MLNDISYRSIGRPIRYAYAYTCLQPTRGSLGRFDVGAKPDGRVDNGNVGAIRAVKQHTRTTTSSATLRAARTNEGCFQTSTLPLWSARALARCATVRGQDASRENVPDPPFPPAMNTHGSRGIDGSTGASRGVTCSEIGATSTPTSSLRGGALFHFLTLARPTRPRRRRRCPVPRFADVTVSPGGARFTRKRLSIILI